MRVDRVIARDRVIAVIGKGNSLPQIYADDRGSEARSPESPTSRVIAVIGKAKAYRRSTRMNTADQN